MSECVYACVCERGREREREGKKERGERERERGHLLLGVGVGRLRGLLFLGGLLRGLLDRLLFGGLDSVVGGDRLLDHDRDLRDALGSAFGMH